METGTRFDLGTYDNGARWVREVPDGSDPTPGAEYVVATEEQAWAWLDLSPVNGNRFYRLAIGRKVRP